MRGLNEMNVIVTGGAAGIGAAISRRLAEEGARVGIFDLDADGAERLADEIRAEGGSADAYAVDIADWDAVQAGVAKRADDAGFIGGLVNNAGWDRAVSFLESDHDLWRKVIDINLYGPLNMTKAVLSRMNEEGRGKIVSMASDAGRVGSSGEAVYSACKGGIIAFNKTVAREMARTGIVINTICPGPTDTNLLDSVDPSGRLKEALAKAIPMRRIAQPEDYPGAVAFLLSDDAGFITGQTLSVSGGLTMAG